MQQRGWRLAAKQLFDRTAAAVGLVMTAPILAGTAAAIRVTMGSPVLFRQKRPGFRGEIIEVFKFRTMRDAVDDHGNPLPDAERLTPLGQLLRSSSVDELPQLLNVLKGELSLVGPRPLLVKYLPLYSPEQARRHDVMPGITGWCQVNGRNANDWDTKLALDIWYVDHWSLWLDLQILVKTMFSVVRRENISQEGHVTMPEFTGSRATS
ncbi:MAG TPA: sugar transferase [Kofleriaceae bacterium]|nr:sugar transferase [Kofleriaceae bacterium]